MSIDLGFPMLEPAPPAPGMARVAEAVRTGECVLFLGSGVHAPPPENSPYRYPDATRPPMGKELACLLARDCQFEKELPGDRVDDLQRVSLCYEHTAWLGREALVDALLELLEKGKEPSPALRMLAALPFKVIVTTNYDTLFDRALRDCGKRVEPLVYKPTPYVIARDRPNPTSDWPLVFKFHGDLTHRESIVITDEDYIGFVQRMSEGDKTHPVPASVRYYMTIWPTLFVGYSLRDYNLRLLIRSMRWGLDPSEIARSYSVDPFPDKLITEVWQNQNRFVYFFAQNHWTFTPWLYREVLGKDFPPDERPAEA